MIVNMKQRSDFITPMNIPMKLRYPRCCKLPHIRLAILAYTLMLGAGVVLFSGCTDYAAPSDTYHPDTSFVDQREVFPSLPYGNLYVSDVEAQHLYAYDIHSQQLTQIADGIDPFVLDDGSVVCVHPEGLVEYTPGRTGYQVIVKRDRRDAPDLSWNDEFRNPKVSRDGRFVAYEGANKDFYVVDRINGTLLAMPGYSEIPGGGGLESLCWTADNRLVMAGLGGLYISDSEWKQLTRINLDVVNPQYPDVSPDGSQILFYLDDAWAKHSGLYTVDLDGKNLLKSFDFYASRAVWSHYGSLIAFTIPLNEFAGLNACAFDLRADSLIEIFTDEQDDTLFTKGVGYQVSFR